jgi:hypothetical protein
MKALFITLTLILMTKTMHAQNTQSKIEAVIETFIMATDEQDAGKLVGTMHEKAMQYVIFGPQLLTFNRQEYADRLKAKKVGGHPRKIEFFHTLISDDAVASVQLSATSTQIKFHYQITLMRQQDYWLIVSISTKAEPL